MNSTNTSNKEKLKYTEKKLKSKFDNLKSDYFLIKIFDNLNKNKLLDIIKYNKNIKKRINISINDYKEYSEKYSSIEIEIKPEIGEYNRQNDGYYYFIDSSKKQYYHIYFNNNKKKIKGNYKNFDEQVKIIRIIIYYQIKSLEKLFYDCECIESINFKIVSVFFHFKLLNNFCKK